MATVYKAYDTNLEREVAVKIIRSGAFPREHLERMLKRFEREAKILASLNHPNIVNVLDSGEQDGTPYLVMEFIPSGTLKEYLNQKPGQPIPWQIAAKLLAPIARALEYAHHHEAKIIHRDVKPSNILITKNGMPMLSDFGIAKVLESEETFELTGTGAGIGTPEYMAPEQGVNKAVDHRADIYSLGTILYEMVAGRKPYQADTPLAVMIKKTTEPLPRPTKFVPNLPEIIERILFKALAKKPEDRYADMGRFADALEKLAEGKLPKLSSLPTIPKPAPVSSTRPKLAIGLIAGLIVCVMGIAGIWIVIRNPNQPIGQNETQMPTMEIPVAEGPVSDSSTTIPTAFPFDISTPINTMISPSNGAELVYVPQGEFIMGGLTKNAFKECQKLFIGGTCSKDKFTNEEPEHTIYLDAYNIDKYEVSNVAYRACVDDDICKPPSNTSSFAGTSYYDDSAYNNYPVINVDWDMANAYCEWRDARLPTEAEWEKAARGENGSVYPWGSSFDGSGVNFCDSNCPFKFDWANKNYNDGYTETAPVDSFPNGISPYGVYNMAGNVWEWVNDWYDSSYYSKSPTSDPAGPGSGNVRTLRGGSWVDPGHYTRTSYRVGLKPSYVNTYVGFRCARGTSP